VEPTVSWEPEQTKGPNLDDDDDDDDEITRRAAPFSICFSDATTSRSVNGESVFTPLLQRKL
jgi:hypothetical protein